MEASWSDQLGNWLCCKEQAGCLHLHHRVTELDQPRDGGQNNTSCVQFQNLLHLQEHAQAESRTGLLKNFILCPVWGLKKFPELPKMCL